jgi:hypothetical protein
MLKHLIILFLISSCGKEISQNSQLKRSENAHQGVSENLLLDTWMSLNFDLLPRKGEVKKSEKFWSGDSWPLMTGSINRRWNSEKQEGLNYLSPSLRQAFTMPANMIKSLSPSEKYDLFMGRYDYPLKFEVDWMARAGTEHWEGLCHGWAGATINHDEPDPKRVINPDGIEIFFGSSDIKALLSYAYSKILIAEQDSLGKRCEDEKLVTEDFCHDDLTPVSFHVVLANKLGLRGQTVIADIDRFKEVWNHPIVKYESTVEKMKSTQNGKVAIIKTRITYLDVVKKNSWKKHPPVYSRMTAKYELAIDPLGNIKKGKWLSHERPDFLWTVRRP